MGSPVLQLSLILLLTIIVPRNECNDLEATKSSTSLLPSSTTNVSDADVEFVLYEYVIDNVNDTRDNATSDELNSTIGEPFELFVPLKRELSTNLAHSARAKSMETADNDNARMENSHRTTNFPKSTQNLSSGSLSRDVRDMDDGEEDSSNESNQDQNSSGSSSNQSTNETAGDEDSNEDQKGDSSNESNQDQSSNGSSSNQSTNETAGDEDSNEDQSSDEVETVEDETGGDEDESSNEISDGSSKQLVPPETGSSHSESRETRNADQSEKSFEEGEYRYRSQPYWYRQPIFRGYWSSYERKSSRDFIRIPIFPGK